MPPESSLSKPPIKAFVIQTGRQRIERGAWKHAKSAELITTGELSGLYRVTLLNGSEALARTIRA